MINNKMLKCPICDSLVYTQIFGLDCGNFDNSRLYQSVKVVVCKKCGHIFNQLSSDQIAGINHYYNYEYAPLNINSPDKVGDRPGSNNAYTMARYGHLYNLIMPYINKKTRILDVGCATGGFLDYLYNNGFKKLYGIDISIEYLRYAKKGGRNFKIKRGDAESIPFGKDSMDIIVIDQVMEHLIDPRRVFKEAKRVLTKGGLFCVSVPDASRYGKKFFFDFFWFLLREHVQHFDLEHLKLLAGQEGFQMIAYNKTDTPMMSEKIILPALSVVFRSVGSGNNVRLNVSKKCFGLEESIKRYIKKDHERLLEKKKKIGRLALTKKKLYVWGISREFLYLYQSAGLEKCVIVELIDANPYKQKNLSVKGKRICGSSVLKKASNESFLLISAIAHTQQIKKELQKIGYQGEIINI